jgi:predicted MPP superfamily phosphohydrolase
MLSRLLNRLEPQLRIRTINLQLPDWPAIEPVLRIAFLSDLHVRSHADVAHLACLIERVSAAKPDIGLLGGDYVSYMFFRKSRIPPRVIAAAIARFRPPLGWFGVFGNHDVSHGVEPIGAAFRAEGIRLLADERISVSRHTHAFDVVGLLPCATELPRILGERTTQAPAIVLAHDPAAFRRLPRGPFLMLSGHTHGGQIQLPWIGPLVNMSDAPLRWTYGHIVEDGRHMYVTSGIGLSGVPVRIGIAPEMVLLEIGGCRSPCHSM